MNAFPCEAGGHFELEYTSKHISSSCSNRRSANRLLCLIDAPQTSARKASGRFACIWTLQLAKRSLESPFSSTDQERFHVL
jgi:hypothetical protein